jgi:hypothetical protein
MGIAMELETLKLLLDKVDGCTFATLDSTTHPIKGLRKVTTGTRVLLSSNVGHSVYEGMVKRRLIEAGKDPRDFVLGDLPFGERIGNTPLILCRGHHYLQTIVLEPGQSVGYTGNREVDLNDFLPVRRTNQGLPKADEVIVSTYRLDHIDRIALMGEILTSEGGMPLIANYQGLAPLGG